ncbi:TauD/TfdA family dioxygenase (plasmid) [Cupriavidus pinatubonensis]|uniref:TauD/TfdA family dioxygenase n=1 Tax=Cupriavidus pinatubonensis TaxID=248026 RepID=UPI001C72AB9C|nr:TauD/TfdA family dioxygenase [Cupriavidus pinatubonensis]QYY33536.1 TauD/TfdA family dioxygenase [Cupriavidus pinatubonensis]
MSAGRTMVASDLAEALGNGVQCCERSSGQPPFFIEPHGDALRDRGNFRAWTRDVMPVLEALITRHGGIVLRGFPTPDTADFADIIDQLPAFRDGYLGGRAPRMQIAGRVMEATRLDASVGLGVHSEMAYRRQFPRRIAFFSRKTAPVGGETTIADARNFVVQMGEDLVAKIASLGIRSALNYGPKTGTVDASYVDQDKYGWNHAFDTDSPDEVEALCAARGLEPLWHDDGSLTVFATLDPFLDHPQTGQRLYRSGLHRSHTATEVLDTEIRKNRRYPTGMFLGSAQRLETAEVDHINAVCDRNTHSWEWRDGDVMILDNLQVWHGRNPYQGQRDVQVALLA